MNHKVSHASLPCSHSTAKEHILSPALNHPTFSYPSCAQTTECHCSQCPTGYIHSQGFCVSGWFLYLWETWGNCPIPPRGPAHLAAIWASPAAVTAFGQPGIAAVNPRVKPKLTIWIVYTTTTHFWSYWGWFKVLGSHTSAGPVSSKWMCDQNSLLPIHFPLNIIGSPTFCIQKFTPSTNMWFAPTPRKMKVLHTEPGSFIAKKIGFPKKSTILPFLFHSYSKTSNETRRLSEQRRHDALCVCASRAPPWPICLPTLPMGIQCVKMCENGRSINPTFESWDFVFLPQSTCSLSGKTTVSEASRKFGKNLPDLWNIGNLPWITRKPFRIKNL